VARGVERGARCGAVSVATARPPRASAFQHPVFVRLWLGSVASNVGTQMNNVAKAWVLYQLTHSALALGVEGLCFSAPIALLPLVTGGLADRLDRVRIVRVVLVAEAVQAFVLALLAACGLLHPWMLYLTAAIDASRLAVAIPAQGAIVPRVVPSDALQSALAISTATWSSAALIGPAIGGLLLASSGAATVFAVNGATTVLAVLAMSGLPALQPERGDSGLGAGLRYLRSHRRVLRLQWVLLMAMTGVLGVETLLPVMATQTWHTGSVGYGLLRTAPGVAAVVAGFALARMPTPGSRAMPLAMVIAAAGVAGFAAAPPLAAALVVLAVASLAFTVTQVIASTEIAREVPDSLRGRVAALGAVGQNGLAGIGAVAVAGAASGVGAPLALAALALTVLLAGAPAVRHTRQG
jgi:MFS family permease